MPSGGHFTTASILAFMFLGVIRGTFSIVIYFAVHSYGSPSLVFLLRSPGTIALYVLFTIFLALRRPDNKHVFMSNFRNLGNYWKSAVMGLVQLAAPYLLFMYGLKILSPTTGGVFMAAAPWLTVIIERLPFVQHKSSVTTAKVLAMILGFAGIIMVSVADVMLALQQPGVCHNVYPNISISNSSSSNMTTNSSTWSDNSSALKINCTPYTHGQVSSCLLALVCGSLMWSISSVFWKSKKGDIHYAVAGIWNNLFGGLYALIIWFVMKPFESNVVHWGTTSGISSIIFLTIVSGWLAAIVVDYMCREVGPVSTNRVLCLVPLIAWMEDWMFIRKFKMNYPTSVIVAEVIGLVLVFVGLMSSSFETERFKNSLQAPLLNPTMDEGANTERFDDDIRDIDDGGNSEEEIVNGSQFHAASLQEDEENPFPPLIEIKPTEKYEIR